MPEPKTREILMEHIRIGNSLRVSAVDVETGTEVTFQAHANASKAELKTIAINKLRYVMQKKKG